MCKPGEPCFTPNNEIAGDFDMKTTAGRNDFVKAIGEKYAAGNSNVEDFDRALEFMRNSEDYVEIATLPPELTELDRANSRTLRAKEEAMAALIVAEDAHNASEKALALAIEKALPVVKDHEGFMTVSAGPLPVGSDRVSVLFGERVDPDFESKRDALVSKMVDMGAPDNVVAAAKRAGPKAIESLQSVVAIMDLAVNLKGKGFVRDAAVQFKAAREQDPTSRIVDTILAANPKGFVG